MKFCDEFCRMLSGVTQSSGKPTGIISSLLKDRVGLVATHFDKNCHDIDTSSLDVASTGLPSSSSPAPAPPSSLSGRNTSSGKTYGSPFHTEDYPKASYVERSEREQIDDLLEESFVLQLMKSRVLPILDLKFELSKCRITPLKVSKRGGIATIEYKLEQIPRERTAQDIISKTLVGKWRRDGNLKQVFDNLKILWSYCIWHGRSDSKSGGYESRLKICEPIAYFVDYNFMLTSNGSGTTFEALLKDNNLDLIEPAVTQSAKWLAKLHRTTPAGVQNIFSTREEEEKLHKWYQHLSLLFPDYAPRIQRLLSYILHEQKKLNPKFFVFINGDFNPLNIIVEGSDLTVVDFEHSCVFDPAKDLAYFISYLVMRKEKYSLNLDVEALEQIFLRNYLQEVSSTKTTEAAEAAPAAAPAALATSLQRIDLYKARSYLQNLHFRYWTLKKKLDDSYLGYWVANTEKCIEDQINKKCHL